VCPRRLEGNDQLITEQRFDQVMVQVPAVVALEDQGRWEKELFEKKGSFQVEILSSRISS
jgi:hypothetical protein